MTESKRPGAWLSGDDGRGVGGLMLSVVWALIPGLAAAIWFYGPGVLVQVSLCTAACVATEALCLGLRKRSAHTLLDGSAMLTGVLLGLSLPAIAPWWIAAFGGCFAIAIGKQVYGGLGYNPFNPAMVGYAALLISFPLEMSRWPLPPFGSPGMDTLAQIHAIFGLEPLADSLTGATALDSLKTQLGLGFNVTQARTASPVFGALGGRGSEWVAGGFLLGGLWLFFKKGIHWQIPAGLIVAIGVLAGLFYLADGDRFAPPTFHLLTGATMLGAFFIATDPVSAAATPRGRLIFGAGIGILTYVIRTFGGYPDGMAFAVLLMNMTVPLLDRWTQPRTFGRGK